MSRTCSVCGHAEREAIDAAIVAGESYRDITARFGVSGGAIGRHRAHVAGVLAEAQAAQDVARGDDLLAKVAVLEADAKRLQDTAEKGGDIRTALVAVRELVRIVEVLARLQGELQDGAPVNILVNPQWVSIRAVIVAALADYPEARQRVVEALRDAGA